MRALAILLMTALPVFASEPFATRDGCLQRLGEALSVKEGTEARVEVYRHYAETVPAETRAAFAELVAATEEAARIHAKIADMHIEVCQAYSTPN